MFSHLPKITFFIWLLLSTVACAEENIALENSRFIIQLTATATEQIQTPNQQQLKLRQWSDSTGLTLRLVSPSNNQRWIITADTENPTRQQALIDVVSKDNAVKYIEADGIMTIMPIQRPIPMRLPPKPI
ncbi:hypothetical protein A9Q99_22220 [Gammaproteobacteria bacterium 45_16_T64]|nr:hypothetical protein A9Q99_22220 [Gammaproteobacteria bacterium 45_16_T64]